jgi:tetratricopeptide (TPR) repeat protein
MAESWKALGEEKLAAEAAKRADALPARTALDYYLLGEYHVHQGQYGKALESFAQALDRQPDHFLSFMRSGQCLQRLERDEAAESMLTGAIALNSRAAYVYYVRGISRQAQRKFDSAMADYRKVAELNPKDYLAYLALGNLLNDKGDLTKAVASFDKALRLNPNSFSSHLDRGLAYVGLGEHEKAMADFTRVIQIAKPLVEIAPENSGEGQYLADAYVNRGLLWARQPRRYKEAAADADEACKWRLGFAWRYGPVHRSCVFYDAACVYSLASAQAAKDEADPERYALARRYAERAVELLRQAIDKGYNDFDHMRKDTDLHPIRQDPAFQELLKAENTSPKPVPGGKSAR